NCSNHSTRSNRTNLILYGLWLLRQVVFALFWEQIGLTSDSPAGHRQMRSLPAPSRALGADRATEAARLPRLGVLGPPSTFLRRPGWPGARRRAGAGRPRIQPDRPNVYRRQVGGYPVPGPPPDRFCLATRFDLARRRPDPPRPVHHGRRPLRASRE